MFKGELTKTEELIWSIVYSEFSDVMEFDVTEDMYIRKHYVDDMYSDDTLRSLMTAFFKQAINKNIDPDTMIELRKKVFIVLERVFNELGIATLSGVRSIDIIDVLEPLKDPIFQEKIKKVRLSDSVRDINEFYKEVDDILRHRLPKNKLAQAYKVKAVKGMQTLQLYYRGRVTDMDGTIYKTPVRCGEATGFETPIEYLIESRTAAKALSQSDTSIAQSEFFAREVQTATMSVRSVVDDVCNSKELMPWIVADKMTDDNGNVLYPGDRPGLIGKHFKYHEDDLYFHVVTKDSDIVGKTIYLRPVNGCEHPDRYSICKACIGDVSYSVPRHYNIGHLFASKVSSILSQLLLSAKHVIASAVDSKMNLDESTRYVLSVQKNGLGFDPKLLKQAKDFVIKIPRDEAQGLMLLKDITKSTDLRTITRISSFILEYTIDNEKHILPVTIEESGNRGSLTMDFLEHAKTVGYTLDERDLYVIPINGFSPNKAFVIMPNVEFSYFDLMKATKKAIFNRRTKRDGTSTETPYELVERLFRMLNAKVTINIAMIEVIVYAFTVYDMPNKNYSLSRGSKNKQLASIKDLLAYRSAGATYGAGRLMSYIHSAAIYRRDKDDHPMDILFFKEPTIEAARRRYKKYNIKSYMNDKK